MNINFELYKVFFEVANAKSISRGAEKLMISQPGVTQAIKTLEEELGGKLFIRTPKGVILTNEGSQLYDYIKEGMNYFINGSNKFMSLKNLDSGVLNIGASTTISEHFLMPYLSKFHRSFPNVDINIINNLTDNLVKDLRNGNLDIVVMAIPKTDIKDLKITCISKLHDIFVGNKEYENSIKTDISDLIKMKLILQKAPSVTRNNFNDFLKTKNLKCDPFMEVVSHRLLTELVLNGFGVGLVTKEFITKELNNVLFEIKTVDVIPERDFGYAIKNEIIPSFSTQKFIEILKEKL